MIQAISQTLSPISISSIQKVSLAIPTALKVRQVAFQAFPFIALTFQSAVAAPVVFDILTGVFLLLLLIYLIRKAPVEIEVYEPVRPFRTERFVPIYLPSPQSFIPPPRVYPTYRAPIQSPSFPRMDRVGERSLF